MEGLEGLAGFVRFYVDLSVTKKSLGLNGGLEWLSVAWSVISPSHLSHLTQIISVKIIR